MRQTLTNDKTEGMIKDKKKKKVLTFSEALANLVPEALKVRAARGLSWPWISVRVL